MTPDTIFRDAKARKKAIEQYAAAHERLAELEQTLQGRGKVYEAQGAHDIALAVLRGLIAEQDDPDPEESPVPDIVHVRDTSSGRVHKRIRVEGTHQLASFEGDNADSSGAYSVLTDAELENVERDDLCGRCFPEPEPEA